MLAHGEPAHRSRIRTSHARCWMAAMPVFSFCARKVMLPARMRGGQSLAEAVAGSAKERAVAAAQLAKRVRECLNSGLVTEAADDDDHDYGQTGTWG